MKTSKKLRIFVFNYYHKHSSYSSFLLLIIKSNNNNMQSYKSFCH